MEVVAKESEATEQPKKSWSEVLTEEVAKADKIATQIREKVLLPSFTLVKMAELMRISRQEAAAKIDKLAKLGYMEEKKQGGVTYYAIVSDPQARIDQIEVTKDVVKAQMGGQIEYLTTLQEITSGYLK